MCCAADVYAIRNQLSPKQERPVLETLHGQGYKLVLIKQVAASLQSDAHHFDSQSGVYFVILAGDFSG